MLTTGDLDLAWLRATLGDDLRAVRVEGLDSGTTSRARVRLTWSGPSDDGDEDARPASVFVKLPADGRGARLFGTLIGLGANEVRFYTEIRAQYDLPAPRCFAGSHHRGGRFVLVLEDLATTGVAFPTVAEGCSAEHATVMMTALAQVHAPLWGSDRFDADLRWVFRPAEGGRVRRMQRVLLRTAVRSARKRLPSELGGETGRLLDDAQRHDRALDAYRATGATTLLHGDTHLGNTYAAADGTGGLYDWQVVQQGHGLRDLAYFVVLSLPTADRRLLERTLIETYLSALEGLGVDPPSLDEAWFLYRLYAVDPLRSAVFTAAMGDRLQPEAQWRTGLERAALAVDDLDTRHALIQAVGPS